MGNLGCNWKLGSPADSNNHTGQGTTPDNSWRIITMEDEWRGLANIYGSDGRGVRESEATQKSEGQSHTIHDSANIGSVSGSRQIEAWKAVEAMVLTRSENQGETEEQAAEEYQGEKNGVKGSV